MSFNGDQLLEILSWLPAKHIYKFSSVCKLTKELLFDEFFIRKQIKNMQIVGDTDFFIDNSKKLDFFIDNSKKLELHEIYSTKSNALTCNLSRESLEFLVKKDYKIVASSNGIICCKNTISSDLFLLNPTTKSYLPIPHPDKRIRDNDMIIFSCEEEYEDNFDYLLLIITRPIEWGGKFNSKIYSPKEKIWKDGGMIDLGARNIFSEDPIYLNGVVYMMSDSFKYIRKGCLFYWPYVVAYDIKNSSTEFLKIPKTARQHLEKSILGIFKWEKKRDYFKTICLAKFFNGTFYVWKLINNDGRSKNSSSYYWSQIFKMHVKDMVPQCSKCVKAFTIINGSVLLFATKKKVYRYELARNNAKLEEICKHKYGGYVRVHSSFSSTLRPCGPGAISFA